MPARRRPAGTPESRTATTAEEAAARRTGRPRAGGRPAAGDPTDEILAAASRLFGQRGVEGTALSHVAAEVGLQQSSLYYYFRRKEELVAELVARANVVPLEALRRISAEGGSPAAQLWRFVRDDIEALCLLPFDINEVHRIAGRDPDGFTGYWKERTAMERLLGRIVRQGVDDGSLRRVDPRLTTLAVLGNDEGVQNWFRRGSRWKPAAIARSLADLTVAGLLAPGGDLDAVRAEAEDRARAATGTGTEAARGNGAGASPAPAGNG
jgi:AcrR family transcriptional regulator